MNCPQFVSDMTLIRDAGGFSHEEGRYLAAPYAQYVAGFAHAFNLMTPGVTDIFAALGPNKQDNVLFALEAYCRENPGEMVRDALYDLIVKLGPDAKNH